MIYGGNFTSRINANIREEKGWSYGVRSSVSSVVGPRVWKVTAQVQSDKTAQSIEELLKELRAVDGDRPFTSDELDDARNERMIETLLPFLGEDQVFVAVGALHLPGEKGLVRLLRKNGFELEPLPLPFSATQ